MKAPAILVIAALAAVSAGARADKKADEAAIRGVYAKFRQAMIKKDLKGITALCTADFTMSQGGRVMSGAQASQMMGQQFKQLKAFDKFEMPIEKLEVNGSTATVVTTNKMVATTMPDPKGKTHKIAGAGKAKATLLKQNGTWKFKLVEETDQKMTYDGQPIGPAAAGTGASAGSGGTKPHSKK